MNSILRAGKMLGMAKMICENAGVPKTFRASQLAMVLKSRKNLPVVVMVDGKTYNISKVGDDAGPCISLELAQEDESAA
jgi:hypothetical protein